MGKMDSTTILLTTMIMLGAITTTTVNGDGDLHFDIAVIVNENLNWHVHELDHIGYVINTDGHFNDVFPLGENKTRISLIAFPDGKLKPDPSTSKAEPKTICTRKDDYGKPKILMNLTGNRKLINDVYMEKVKPKCADHQLYMQFDLVERVFNGTPTRPRVILVLTMPQDGRGLSDSQTGGKFSKLEADARVFRYRHWPIFFVFAVADPNPPDSEARLIKLAGSRDHVFTINHPSKIKDSFNTTMLSEMRRRMISYFCQQNQTCWYNETPPWKNERAKKTRVECERHWFTPRFSARKFPFGGQCWNVTPPKEPFRPDNLTAAQLCPHQECDHVCDTLWPRQNQSMRINCEDQVWVNKCKNNSKHVKSYVIKRQGDVPDFYWLERCQREGVCPACRVSHHHLRLFDRKSLIEQISESEITLIVVFSILAAILIGAAAFFALTRERKRRRRKKQAAGATTKKGKAKKSVSKKPGGPKSAAKSKSMAVKSKSKTKSESKAKSKSKPKSKSKKKGVAVVKSEDEEE